MPEPEELAAFGGTGFVVAPAGFGKTHLLAASLLHATRRQLVLTHTYAGVNALRRKIRFLRIPDGASRVDTIASWALRLALSYRDASGWTIERPTGEEWRELYGACSRLLDQSFVRRLVRASYGGMYVDEYQDCSLAQHEIVLKLARDLPCRILGDPMQSIFDFNDAPIDWRGQVSTALEPLGQLQMPYRWALAGSHELGRWLVNVRTALESGEAIDLRRGIPRGATAHLSEDDGVGLRAMQMNVCLGIECQRGHSVIAIHKGDPLYKARCHRLAKQTGGRFVSIEEIEGREVFQFLERIERAQDSQDRLKQAVELATKAMTGVGTNLPAGTGRGEHVVVRENTRNVAVARAANLYLETPSSSNLVALFLSIQAIPGVHVARADLLGRVLGVLRKHAMSADLSLAEAASKYQAQFRHRGRPVGRRKLVGTTLLVKGLEFHHAIVLDAASLRRNELYVALTRGAKSLAIVSTTPLLRPAS